MLTNFSICVPKPLSSLAHPYHVCSVPPIHITLNQGLKEHEQIRWAGSLDVNTLVMLPASHIRVLHLPANAVSWKQCGPCTNMGDFQLSSGLHPALVLGLWAFGEGVSWQECSLSLPFFQRNNFFKCNNAAPLFQVSFQVLHFKICNNDLEGSLPVSFFSSPASSPTSLPLSLPISPFPSLHPPSIK